MEATKTLKVRVKDKHSDQLSNMAGSCNFVWNYINELSNNAIIKNGEFLSAFDLQKYTKGANKELGLHSQTPQMIGKEYATRRKQFKKSKLAWRKTQGVRRSLGWIPLNGQSIKWKNGQLFHNGNYFGVWDSYGLSEYKFRSGCFSEDSRGRWYFCVVISFNPEKSNGNESVGLDLGCKDAVTASTGEKVEGRHFRKLELELAKAQRANKKKRAKAIHAKIKNRRLDDHHKFSSKLVKDNAAIFVGNVSASGMAKTKMAKSSLDAGWGMLKTMLEYKCANAGIVYEEVNESYTTQVCSCCGSNPDSSPKGRAGLGIREWTCTECGTAHDRDINAAMNILAVGHYRLAGGIPCL